MDIERPIESLVGARLDLYSNALLVAERSGEPLSPTEIGDLEIAHRLASEALEAILQGIPDNSDREDLDRIMNRKR